MLHLRGTGEAFGWQAACACLKRMRILNHKLMTNKVRPRPQSSIGLLPALTLALTLTLALALALASLGCLHVTSLTPLLPYLLPPYSLPQDADRNDINKFLNRLLGLPFAQQNALFDYYTQARTLLPTPSSPSPKP